MFVLRTFANVAVAEMWLEVKELHVLYMVIYTEAGSGKQIQTKDGDMLDATEKSSCF